MLDKKKSGQMPSKNIPPKPAEKTFGKKKVQRPLGAGKK